MSWTSPDSQIFLLTDALLLLLTMLPDGLLWEAGRSKTRALLASDIIPPTQLLAAQVHAEDMNKSTAFILVPC